VKRLRAERLALEIPAKLGTSRAAPKTEVIRTKKPGLSQKEQRRLAEVEAAMAALHTRIAALDALTADPMAFSTAEAPGHQALKDRGAAKVQLEMLEMEWLELEEKRG
jgi:ATP-binding cassette subfamily F protein uup